MYKIVRLAGIVFAAGAFLISCTLPSLLVMDPVLYGFQGKVSTRHSSTVVLDGQYPWEQELHQAVASREGIKSVILSPLLDQAGRAAAIDHPSLDFYLIGSDRPPGNEEAPENYAYIAIDRTAAIEQLANILIQYMQTIDVSSSEDVHLTLLLYTGTERRRRESDLLQSLLSDVPADRIRVREYESLSSRRGIVTEIGKAADTNPHLLVALLGSHSPNAIRMAVENDVFVFSENVSEAQQLTPLLVGGIETNFDAAVSSVVRSINRAHAVVLPAADFWISPATEFPSKYFMPDDR